MVDWLRFVIISFKKSRSFRWCKNFFTWKLWEDNPIDIPSEQAVSAYTRIKTIVSWQCSRYKKNDSPYTMICKNRSNNRTLTVIGGILLTSLTLLINMSHMLTTNFVDKLLSSSLPSLGFAPVLWILTAICRDDKVTLLFLLV